ncbi:inositol hexakisphosphate-domain-containing protein [Flagelloscypha sp. PMI_526]|nr:inositol hexakisphosphate-domain-containing protein [Flagelloscypha sp. PMI_526]
MPPPRPPVDEAQFRSTSVPPAIPGHLKHDSDPGRPSSIPPVLGGNDHSRSTSTSNMDRLSFDLMAHLDRSTQTVVKTRAGSVLSRGMIIKTDFYPSGRALDIDLNLHGAPNFRAPRGVGSLNVYGVAQPRTQGLRAILSVLKARPGLEHPSLVVWVSTREEPVVYISGRPFVLRDAADPKETLALSDRAENLEAIEMRLKKDILNEAAKFGGLVLTHNEMAADSGEGAILPTWTAVDVNNVRTSRELYEHMKQQGWSVEYHRVPISPDRPIEDNYLDAYLRVVKSADPLTTSLVFSCGMGAVRTTFAMVSACIIRRKQLMSRGLPDPFALKPMVTPPTSQPGLSTSPRRNAESKLVLAVEQSNAQQDMNRALLRLTYLLQQCLPAQNAQGAISLLMSQVGLLDNLRKAYTGSYSVILSLLGCLDRGLETKRLVDRVIEANDHVTHMREEILLNRLRYSQSTLDDDGMFYLVKARKALEKYFFVLAFASYVEESENFEQPFASWLKARTEIWNQTSYLRRAHGSPLNFFAPIHDLSSLSKSGSETRDLVPGRRNEVAIRGGQILGDEYSGYVVKNRSGIILREDTLLKSDQWLKESESHEDSIRGTTNFRRIKSANIYALGQPTLEAVDEVIARLKRNHPSARNIIWTTLREEPIVYVNGVPYCLRRERFAVRNMKDYGGISASRLEVLEERLKDDVLAELKSFDQHVLLHSETSDGSVVPVWEEARNEDVMVLKDIMAARESNDGVHVSYIRIPITAERTPDYSDLMELLNVAARTSADTPIIVNCQLGRGRSTMASVMLLMVQKWLESQRLPQTPTTPKAIRRTLSMALTSTDKPTLESMTRDENPAHRHSYQVINNLLRVIPRGRAVKKYVDDAIDQCSSVLNLREVIEQARASADEKVDEQGKKTFAQRGLQNLRRYFELMVFQAYLQSLDPDSYEHETIEKFVKSRPVIKTFQRELFAEGLEALRPLERHDVEDGVAYPDEVQQVVMNRSGGILSASTILKSDFFSNLQKMSLPERIDGSPNFRRIPLIAPPLAESGRNICGSGMPTLQGLRNALARVDAAPEGKNTVFWTSLREEPVIYVAGRPHVLRLVDKPLENVEATGVTTATVEAMEKSFKKDVLQELRASEDGRILLHDEVEERPGVFSIIPIWETVSEEDILTPRDVFDIVVQEGYRVNYGRVAITDEQAPLPVALDQLYERVTAGLSDTSTHDFIFNCQMGRGRTTTGMTTACLIATINTLDERVLSGEIEMGEEDETDGRLDQMDGFDEALAYQQGEYKTILQLVGVLSHGKVAKELADQAIDLMQDVQNLRKAVYDYKLKTESLQPGSSKEKKMRSVAVNYLYRYGALIVFANYLIEVRRSLTSREEMQFPKWLKEHREITMLLSRKSLD